MAVEEAGLVPLDAPLPQPRLYDLLAGAREVAVGADDHWLAGARLRDYPPGPAYTFDPCGAGTYRMKADGGEFASPMLGTFTVYVPTVCTARSVGDALNSFSDRLRLAFVALEGPAIERFFATGDGHADLGPYLTDGNLEILAGTGNAVDPVEGLALLEQEIATVGNGMIHVPPATATYWVSEYLIEAGRDGKMRTRLGTLVTIGAGYMEAYPDDEPGTPPAGQEWAYATGPVEYRRSEITILPNNYAQALNRAQNEVVLLAERNYLLTWVGRADSSDEAHIQAGVLIDRQP